MQSGIGITQLKTEHNDENTHTNIVVPAGGAGGNGAD